MSYLIRLECGRCQTSHDSEQLLNVCTACGGPLLARYDLEAIGKDVTRDALSQRPAGLWKFHELLPPCPGGQLTLGEGTTPLVKLSTLGGQWGLDHLLIKDEGRNPGGSFKDRGAAVGVARARELGATAVTLPTAGNAGGAWSAYAARAGLACHVFLPADAPRVFSSECVLHGAATWLVDGLISDAGRVAEEQALKHGWFVASTLKEPYRIEGKKTMGFEIAEQLGWRWPSAIVYPTGGGVGLIAIWKAVQELSSLGWVQGPLPRMVAVQASGCKPVVDAFRSGESDTSFYEGASTIAAGIRVPGGLGHFLVLDAIYASGGTALDIADPEIIETQKLVARQEGIWICPEGAAAVAATRRLTASGCFESGDTVLVLNTGSGVKYMELLRGDARVWETQE